MKKSLCLLLTLLLLLGLIAVPASAEPSFEGKTLNVLLSASTFSESVEPFIKDFEEKYGCKVNYDLLGRSNFDEKIVIELSSGSSAHDVYYVFGESLMQYVNNDWLMPLDDFLANEDLVDAEQLGYDDFSAGPLQACTVNGVTYGLPIFSASCIMYYRTDYFEQAGIESVPATWDELMEACQKLKDIGVEPIGMRGNKAFGGSIWHLPMIYLSNGASVYKDFPNDLHPVVNSPEFVEAVQYYSDLLNNYGMEGATTCNYEDIILAVQQGNLGIWIDGAPLVNQMVDPEKSKSAGKVGYAVIPAGKEGVTAAQNTHLMSMNKNAEEPELAYKFIEWCASRETMLKVSTEGYHVGVPRPSVMESEEYKAVNNYGDGAWAQAFASCLSMAHPNYYPLNEDWPEVADIISAALSEVFTGRDAQEAMDEANDKIDRLMRQKGHY